MTQPVSITELINGLLDRDFNRTVAPVLRAIASTSKSGIVAQRLKQIDEEAADLMSKGQKLTPDNPVLRALLADLEIEMRRNAARIDGIAPDLQQAAGQAAGRVQRQLALPFDAERLLGVSWNIPDPEAVAQLVDFVGSEAWRDLLDGYPKNIANTVGNQAIRGIVEGWSPLKTARQIRHIAEGLPVAQANTMARTLQLTSYRTATAVHQQANADILDGAIRIATLDDRTCLSCIALHGTLLEVGERVDDHHNGRCTSVPVVKGTQRTTRTGTEWFESLPENRQRVIAGPAKFDALKRGDARLNEFVGEYDDAVFGRMLGERSLKSVLK